MKIWFRINGLEFCSWFIVFKHLMQAFKRIGVDVPDSPFTPPKKSKDYVEFHWADPAFWDWSKQKVKLKAGLALSEHTSLLAPEKAIPNLQRCDVLLCPCRSAAQAYYEAPLDMPIEIVPFGVDDRELQYHQRDWNDTPFKFLVIGVAQFRKGTWLAVEAFRQAFGDSDKVQLTVASFNDSPMFERLQADYAQYENITFHGKAEKVQEYYHSHHCLLSPHLAEGWALSIPEALATGMPCIVARCSAPREYFNTKYGWWMEMSDLYAPVEQCLVGVNGSWRLPSVESLAEQMKYAADHREECQEKGLTGSEYVLQNLTWRQSAEKTVNIFERYI